MADDRRSSKGILKGPNLKEYTQLSCKPSAAPELIPKRFKMPEVPKYDRTSDPREHITTYSMAVKGNDLAPHEIESVFLKQFGETHMRGALTWYSLLPEDSIDSFEMLADSFIKAHVGARKKERMSLLAIPNEWAAETLTKRLNLRSLDSSRKLKESLLEFQATTWENVHNRYKSKIRIKDEQVGSTSSAKGRKEIREKSKDDYDADKRTLRDRFLPYERTKGCGRNFREANKLSLTEGPIMRNPNLWCEYHGTNGHRTGDCRHLWEEVATLLKNDHLREFLSDRSKNNYGSNRDNAEPSKAREEPAPNDQNDLRGE
ncbi:uncharacterized protein LOC142177409 [Nicotiana tabacum]|uniref:Uncharacterized protein LOC142177409 n=1 Tax=Nicotiana tabacum TaxID=4097 RepID=A0AC58TXQ6_TOBAC